MVQFFLRRGRRRTQAAVPEGLLVVITKEERFRFQRRHLADHVADGFVRRLARARDPGVAVREVLAGEEYVALRSTRGLEPRQPLPRKEHRVARRRPGGPNGVGGADEEIVYVDGDARHAVLLAVVHPRQAKEREAPALRARKGQPSRRVGHPRVDEQDAGAVLVDAVGRVDDPADGEVRGRLPTVSRLGFDSLPEARLEAQAHLVQRLEMDRTNRHLLVGAPARTIGYHLERSGRNG